MKQDIFAQITALIIFDVISCVLDGMTVFHTPTAIARVDRLEKPLRAYVVIDAERSCKILEIGLRGRM